MSVDTINLQMKARYECTFVCCIFNLTRTCSWANHDVEILWHYLVAFGSFQVADFLRRTVSKPRTCCGVLAKRLTGSNIGHIGITTGWCTTIIIEAMPRMVWLPACGICR